MLTSPEPAAADGDADGIVAFIAAEQAHPQRRIIYVGVETAGIQAELEALAPPWLSTVRVTRDGAEITGVVLVEVDEELGRAWIIGPWARGDGDEWMHTAGGLLDAALAQLPPAVTGHEMCGDSDHRLLATLAELRGWRPSEANHILVVDPSVVGGWPAGDDGLPARHRPAAAGDVDAIAVLHDAEFPDTYATAQGLLDDQAKGARVVLVVDDDAGRVVGYAAGEIHSDGEGFIDFLGVAPAARGAGLGRHLAMAITRALLERSPLDRVALTVQDHRAPARALYERLGFRSEGTLVAYRSQ